MFVKTLLGAALAAGALTALSAAANAQAFDRSSQDRCNPEAWQTFGFSVENRDYDLMAQMLNDSQYRACDFFATVEVLFCEANPLACIEPAGGPDDDPGNDPNDDPNDDPQDDPKDEPEDPLGGDTRPGQGIGTDNGGDDGGNDDGGNQPTSNEPSGDNGRDPTGGNDGNSIGSDNG